MVALQINATQATGLAAFFTACVLAAFAAKARRGRDRQIWAVLALVHAFLWLDVLVSARHTLHAAIDDYLVFLGLYGVRRILQAFLLLALAMMIVGTLVWIWRTPVYAAIVRARARTAAAATLAVAAVFAIETISLHQIDAFLYAHIGPVLVIGWLWASTALVVAIAAAQSIRTTATPSSLASSR